eukprot:g2598.t1
MAPHFIHSSLLLNQYRNFLSKLTSKAPIEENRFRHGQKKSKLLLRLRARALLAQSSVDPFRTFRKLKTAINRWKMKTGNHRVIGIKSRNSTQWTEFEKLFGSGGLIRSVLFLALGGASKVFMNLANSTSVLGREHLDSALDRKHNQPLITVCNHTGALDDPLVIASMVPSSVLYHPERARWTLCATDRCFKNAILTGFFRSVKVLPVERGAGLNQLGMKAAELCLNQGGWIHIFPEGTRSQNGELLPPRLGIGKLVASCDQLPLVVPFIHSGMETVMPSGSILPKGVASERGWTDRELFQEISWKIGVRMAELWSELENKPMPLWAQKKLTESHSQDSILANEVERLKQRVNFSLLELMKDRLNEQLRNWKLQDYLEYCISRQKLMIASLSE